MRGSRFLALTLVVASLAGCSGTGGGGDTPTDPGGPTLSLTADSTSLFIGATTEITAVAHQANGQPIVNAPVDFSTTLGVLSESRVATDAQGRAEVVLRGTQAGEAVVTARLSGAPSASVTIQVGQGNVVLVLPASSTIPSQGQTAISIRVARRDGEPTPIGTEVEVTTTLGELSNMRPRTDALGLATTTLFGRSTTGTAVIRATLPGQSGSGQAEVHIGEGRKLRLAANPSTITPDGNARVAILLTESSGAPARGASVQLTTDIGRLEDTLVTTDSAGTASTVFRPDGSTGVASISGNANGVTALVAVLVDGRAQLRLRATPPSLAPNGAATITVTGTFVDGRPIPSGSRVRLATTLGTLDSADLVTNSTGVATTTLRGTGVRGTAQLVATALDLGGSGSLDVPIR